MYYLITASHRSTFPDPIRFSPGERLILGKRDEDYPGWIWVTTPPGNQGWAPESLLEIESETAAVARAEYTAKELNTRQGERVRCIRELAGWLWVENEAGQAGWIPAASARPEEMKS